MSQSNIPFNALMDGLIGKIQRASPIDATSMNKLDPNFVRHASAPEDILRLVKVVETMAKESREREKTIGTTIAAGFEPMKTDVALMHYLNSMIRLLTDLADYYIRTNYNLWGPDVVGVMRDGEDVVIAYSRDSAVERAMATMKELHKIDALLDEIETQIDGPKANKAGESDEEIARACGWRPKKVVH